MRTPLAAAAAALAFLPVSPAHAAGVLAVPLSGTSFFRPTWGVALAGACSYDGTVLNATATATAVGGTGSVSITCTLHTASGSQVGYAAASGGPAATNTTVVPIGATPAKICGSASAYVSGWSIPATDSACASVR